MKTKIKTKMINQLYQNLDFKNTLKINRVEEEQKN